MSSTSTLHLRIFDGTRQPFPTPAKFLVTITDGNQSQHVRDYYESSDLTFTGLPFFDNFGDGYSVVVWVDGYRQAGFVPVSLSNSYERQLDIMLVAKDSGFNFAAAKWDTAKAAYPFIASPDLDDPGNAARYGNFLDQQEKSLACLLNLGEAMGQINLPQGTPLDYIKELRWDPPFAPAQDRFFAWCDASLVAQVKTAAADGQFAVEHNPGILHPGATSSWKQIEFGEANVQLTFHENDTKTINGTPCVMIEPDMDYYRDLAAHTILEVIPNAVTNTLTDPVEVYVLRWIAGRTAGVPEFAPLYVIT
jgi:hypothetical protein